MFEAWTLREDSVKTEEEQLRETVRSLEDQDRATFYRIYNKTLKDPDTYAVLNWLFLAGLHHFYLGKFVRGTINIIIMIFGLYYLFVIPLFGIILIFGVSLIEIPALFRSQLVVTNHNVRLGFSILEIEHLTYKSKSLGGVKSVPTTETE